MIVNHILVVDDSATDRFFLSDMLEKADYHVTLLESGKACVEQVAVIKPDLIIMDIIMEGLSGFQATHSLKKSCYS